VIYCTLSVVLLLPLDARYITLLVELDCDSLPDLVVGTLAVYLFVIFITVVVVLVTLLLYVG